MRRSIEGAGGNVGNVALLYPRTAAFRNPLRYRFVEDALAISCFPFDVADPEGSVRALLDGLLRRRRSGRAYDTE